MMEEKELLNKMLEKSQEAFVMSVEIYNKPTIKYRVEGFAFFIQETEKKNGLRVNLLVIIIILQIFL